MSHPSDRLSLKKWGVLNHYLYRFVCNPALENNLQTGITDWNEAVNRFDVERVAYNLHKMNVGYYFLTILQGYKYMLGPNAAFDKIAGTKPGEACSVRDLPMELADELAKYDIDFCLYFTGDGPHCDPEYNYKFGYTGVTGDGQHVTADFVYKWNTVLEEYAMRYGDKVKAWWVDGCYYTYLGYTDELCKLYYDTIKKGNPNAAATFNNGAIIRLEKGYSGEDFTAGEDWAFYKMPRHKYIDNSLVHILAPLGYGRNGTDFDNGWNCTGIKHTEDYMVEYIRNINKLGGAVTIDAFIGIDGSFDPEQEALLRRIGQRV